MVQWCEDIESIGETSALLLRVDVDQLERDRGKHLLLELAVVLDLSRRPERVPDRHVVELQWG